MSSVWGHDSSHREYSSITLFGSFPSLELGYKLSDQFVGLLRANLPIAVIPVTIPSVSKYMKKDL